MKQQKININKETGRSMVEMLGVLAVIGVLSIGGIAGYTMAMNRHRANELLDGASKRAIVAMQQISLGKSASEVSLGEFTSNVVAGGTFSGNVLDLGDGEIGIQASGIEKAVCENLVNMATGDVEVVKVVSVDEVTEMEASDCSDTASNNTLAILFKDSGSGAGGGSDSCGGRCAEYETCTDGTCECSYGLDWKNECAICAEGSTKCVNNVLYECGLDRDNWAENGTCLSDLSTCSSIDMHKDCCTNAGGTWKCPVDSGGPCLCETSEYNVNCSEYTAYACHRCLKPKHPYCAYMDDVCVCCDGTASCWDWGCECN